MRQCASVAAILLMFAAGGGERARAAGDVLTPFEDADASPQELASLLVGSAADLRRSKFAAREGSAVVVSRDPQDARSRMGKDLDSKAARSADLLRNAGWNLPAPVPEILVVRVSVPGAQSCLAGTPDGAVWVIREGDPARDVPPPAPPVRIDGPPIERDVVRAAHRARVWAGRSAATSTATWADEVAARRVVRWALPGAETPRWIFDGIVAWSVSVTRPPDVRTHVCGAWAAPAPAAVQSLVGAAGAPPSSSVPYLGRLLATMIGSSKDAPLRIATFSASAGTPAARFEKAFGATIDAAVAAANAVPSNADSTRCDPAGVVCPACTGAGKHDVACPGCSGLGNVGCPSCGGSDGCPNCKDGNLYYEGGRKVKCRLCTGGKSKCVACNNSLKTSCKACSGSGKSARDCIACTAGRLPCPAAGAASSDAEPCTWCADQKIVANCGGCAGAGYSGCDDCFGSTRDMCARCGGTGEIRMVFDDGTVASNTKCGVCSGKGFSRCAACKGGKLACDECQGKGRVARDPAACLACRGAGTLPDAATLTARADGTDLTPDEVRASKAMLERAIASLLTCANTPSGAFALRELRRGRHEGPGKLLDPIPFSNAMALWTLGSAGHDMEDPDIRRARDELLRSADQFVAGTAEYMGSQGVSLTLRAVLAAGEDPKGPRVRGLVDRLVKGQRPSGFWSDSLTELVDDSSLDTLFVAEALRAARLRGARVPGAVWTKLLRGASSLVDGKYLSAKNEWLIGTDVASGVALVIMAKEGTLGANATGFDYASLPQVTRGVAWLDRYFDILAEPQFSNGVRRPETSDAGYMAWLFSVQRLGMLLRTEELGGTRWYAEAVRHLLKIQYSDGSFEERSRYALNGALRTTCGAILFLVRATPPITDVGGDE